MYIISYRRGIMNNLLIDVGSTFIKYCVYDVSDDKELLFDKTEFPNALLCKDKHYLVSGKEIINKIKAIFSAVKSFHCKKAFISVQMHGYLLKKDDKFTDYVSWRDKSGDISRKDFVGVDFDDFGTSLKENLPLAKIDNDEECEFFTLGSFIVWSLTGNNITHITDACPSGFFNVKDGSKNKFCKMMTMPNVYLDVKPVGKFENTEIYVPIGDHQISFLGSKANEDKYLLNIGTATQISCVADLGFAGKCEKRPYFDKNKRLYTLSGLTGGYQIETDENKDKLICQIKDLIGNLPYKKTLLMGGGGAPHMYEYIKKNKIDLDCELIKNNIGMEGLKMIARENNTKIGYVI